MILQNLLSLGGISWLLVADESIGISRGALVANLDLLNLSELTEKILEVHFTPALGEVFDEQVASLFGSLISYGVTFLLGLALSWFQGWTNCELDTWNNLEIVHVQDGFLSTLRSVLFVLVVWIGVANKGKLELLNFVSLTKFKRTDVSKRLEHLFDFLISFFDGDVLHIDVVNDLSEISLVFWLVLEGFNFANFASLHSILGE